MEYTYINKEVRGIYATFPYELDANNEIGTTWEDYVAGMWVMLSEEQLAWKAEHPTASVQEVFNMQVTPPVEPTPEQKLRQAQNVKYMEINNAASAASHYYVDENDVYTADRLSVKNLCNINKTVSLNGVSYKSEILSKAMDEVSVQSDKINSVASTLSKQVQEAAAAEDVEAIEVTGFPETISTTTAALQKSVDSDKHKNASYQTQRLMSRIINEPAIMTLSTKEAFEYQYVYPYWGEENAEFGKEVEIGFRFNYTSEGEEEPKLYEVIQKHTLQEHWKPDSGTESLYKVIDVEHAGTKEDPIPWKYNMQVFNGKYYTCNEVLYLGIRDSGIALAYNDLADLVSAGYVKVVEE